MAHWHRWLKAGGVDRDSVPDTAYRDVVEIIKDNY